MKTKLKEKSYRLSNDRSGESCLIKTGRKRNLTIMDEKLNTRRAIRHCPNQSTVYVLDQDKFALVEPIIFKFGQLKVPADQPMTQKFLDLHPSNAANGGSWFEEVDEVQEARENISDVELKTDIYIAIKEVAKEKDGIHKLSAVVAVLLNSVDDAAVMGIEELKRELYKQVDIDTKYFTDEGGDVTIFDDDGIYRKYLTLKALKEGIIRKSGNGKSILWGGKEGKVIATSPASIEIVEYFSEYLTTDDGILVLEKIVQQS